MDLIRKNGCAGFEMDTAHELVRADAACGFSFRYRSIGGEGRIAVVEDPEEKRHGLDCIMKHMSGTGTWDLCRQPLRNALWRIRNTRMRLQRRQRDSGWNLTRSPL